MAQSKLLSCSGTRYHLQPYQTKVAECTLEGPRFREDAAEMSMEYPKLVGVWFNREVAVGPQQLLEELPFHLPRHLVLFDLSKISEWTRVRRKDDGRSKSDMLLFGSKSRIGVEVAWKLPSGSGSFSSSSSIVGALDRLARITSRRGLFLLLESLITQLISSKRQLSQGMPVLTTPHLAFLALQLWHAFARGAGKPNRCFVQPDSN